MFQLVLLVLHAASFTLCPCCICQCSWIIWLNLAVFFDEIEVEFHVLALLCLGDAGSVCVCGEIRRVGADVMKTFDAGKPCLY